LRRWRSSSTVPALEQAIGQIAARRRIPSLVAGADTIPMAIEVDQPGEVGPDRLVNAYAAAHLLGRPAVVIDCGTATTFDAVDARGDFVGGAIAPGLGLGLEALAAHTARLPWWSCAPRRARSGAIRRPRSGWVRCWGTG